MPRRTLALCLLLASCEGAAPPARAPFFPGATPIPASGIDFEGGRLAVARAYGYADFEQRVPMTPTTRLRLASLSKPLTAVAVLRLAEEGRLDLDQPVTRWLTLPEGADVRLDGLTVRHLLEHAGGWDRARSGDPVARLPEVAAALGVPGPVSAHQLAGHALGQRLDFEPGARFAYSNLGYVLLGRIVEQVTGEAYADHVRRSVCDPAGIADLAIGATRAVDLADGEARYYDFAAAAPQPSVLPGEGLVPRPYGWTHLAAMDAAGGWIGSAVDLVRFMSALDGSRGVPLVAQAGLDAMTARPALPEWAGAPSWFGLGMQVQPAGAGQIWHHGGSMPGSSVELLRAPNGWSVALVLNTRPADGEVDRFEQELVDLAWALASAPPPAPAGDLFPQLP